MDRSLIRIGAILGFLAVALGAFGAHGLEGRVTPDRLEVFEVGVRYHMLHAVVLLVLGAAAGAFAPGRARRAALAFCLGIVLFSGSLYLLVLLDQPRLGAITPLGGLALLAGWVLAASPGPEGPPDRPGPPVTGAP